jgi:acetolactate synthase regulatory subunit
MTATPSPFGTAQPIFALFVDAAAEADKRMAGLLAWRGFPVSSVHMAEVSPREGRACLVLSPAGTRAEQAAVRAQLDRLAELGAWALSPAPRRAHWG